MLNKEVIQKIIELNLNDREMLDAIFDALNDFEEYHHAIYEMETRIKVYSGDTSDREEYLRLKQTLDTTRTRRHNLVISDVAMLNRIAKNCGLDPVYDDVISEEQPYRRNLANAVLDYVADVITNRR